MRVASNFPTAYVRVASQTYVLQHIFLDTLCGYEAGVGVGVAVDAGTIDTNWSYYDHIGKMKNFDVV